jgi:hypothetical protein
MRSIADVVFRRAMPVLLVSLCGVAACTKNLNVAAVGPSIRQGVADQVGVTLASVTCPSEPRPLAVNDPSTASAMSTGVAA